MRMSNRGKKLRTCYATSYDVLIVARKHGVWYSLNSGTRVRIEPYASKTRSLDVNQKDKRTMEMMADTLSDIRVIETPRSGGGGGVR